MRRKVELFIAGMRVDLSDDSFVLLNYTHDDLTNPTILKNSYSQTITIPETAANNKIFGAVWRFDRSTIAGGGAGVNFDAAKKTPFLLFVGAECIESGYTKLDAITRQGGNVSYKISLYGGLGSFFYSLSYDEDGNKRSLADLDFDVLSDYFDNQVKSFVINRAKVSELWEDMDLNMLSFAPCYNGIPADFDATRVVAGPFLKTDPSESVQVGFPPFLFYKRSVTEDDVTFSLYDKRYTVMTFNNALTEWQIQDLRSYLQRPVIRLMAVILAACDPANNGGYSVNLDPTFFNEENPYWYKTWMTLPLLTDIVTADGSAIRSGSTITQAMLLGGTLSPADYFISFCKMFGLAVIVNNATKTVDIMTRGTFFDKSADIIDIEKRVAEDMAVDILPYPYSTKWYALRQEVQGQWAENYKDTTGKTFGEQRINTGYDFDVTEKSLLDGLAFRGAVEVLERSPLFSVIDYTDGDNTTIMPSAIIDGGTYTLYDIDSTTTDVDITRPGDALLTPLNEDFPYYDVFAKPQLHDADNKPADGSNVLVFFRGRSASEQYKGLHLSDDMAIMDDLNDVKPCWMFPFILNGENLESASCQMVSTIPSFGRYLMNGNTITHSLDFGNPAELAIPGKTIDEGAALYPRYWRDYIADRFDNDSKVVTCFVDMRSMPQGSQLLRRFVYYGGAIWAVNKIINQPITTDDLTKVELVKVQDIEKYR